jgi:hypothetical protein
MGASRFDVTVPGPKGPVTFDLYAMSKDERRKFHRAFMTAYRENTAA